MQSAYIIVCYVKCYVINIPPLSTTLKLDDNSYLKHLINSCKLNFIIYLTY